MSYEKTTAAHPRHGRERDTTEVRKGALQQARQEDAPEVREEALCGVVQEALAECEICHGEGEVEEDLYDTDSHQYMRGVGRRPCICTL